MTRRSPFHAAWWKKFRDLPIVGGRSIITPHDGDTAQLNELVEKIFGHPRLRLDEDDMLPPDWLWERTVAGTVKEIVGEIDPQSRTRRVKVQLPGDAGEIVAPGDGMVSVAAVAVQGENAGPFGF